MEKVLSNLLSAIDSNIQNAMLNNETSPSSMPVIPLQYIADELEEARTALDELRAEN